MRICVFCGSAAGRRPLYTEAARELGTLLAGAGIGLVYGGATVGTMGTIARAALDTGGEVIGVIPQQLVEREIAHKHLSEQHVVAELLDVEPAPAIDAVGWVCVRDRRVLMVRSRDNELLFLPGGKREPGESDVRALCREVQEELSVGLRPETFCYFDSVREPADGFDDGRQVNMVCYLAAHSGTPRASGEVTELAWLRRGDTDLVPPAGRRVLAELAARDLID